MSEPPQHVLGGLNVAILAGARGSPEQLNAVKDALEEFGVIVSVLSLAPGSTIGAPAADGDAPPRRSDQAIAESDPDAYDGLVVIGGSADDAQALSRDPAVLDFIRGLAAEDKPLAAIAEGERLLAACGLPPGASWLTAPDGDSLESFHTELRQLLADRRRKSFLTIGDDTPSAVGEDG